MEDEYKIVYSPFEQRVTREGASVDVLIYLRIPSARATHNGHVLRREVAIIAAG